MALDNLGEEVVHRVPQFAFIFSQEACVSSASVRIRMKQILVPGFTLWLVHLLALQLVLFPALADASAAPRAQEKTPLGALSSVGQVYVSNSVVPAESTIFAGDTLRTGEMATATFTTSGKGSYEITPRSQLVFTGSQQYVAELKSGTVVMSSVNGPSGINLRVGSFVVVAVTQGEQSTSKIDSAADGSFLVTSTEGSVGIVPLEGPPNGVFLQKGQAVIISPQGVLSAPASGVLLNTEPEEAPPQTPSAVKNSHTGWIILGVAAGGGAAAAAALAGHKSSSTVSPSSVE
jgi:hypothetical protein